MKKQQVILGILLAVLSFVPFTARAADDPMVFDSTNNYLGACSYTDSSTWALTQSLTVSKIQLWYYWQSGETSLPVTVKKDGQDFATFTAVRGACDPYQASWCNGDYTINKEFPAGTYTTTIPNAYQCLKPGGTGTVRLYGTTTVAETTNTNRTANVSDDTTNTNAGLTAQNSITNTANVNATATNATNVNATQEAAEGTSNTTLYVIIGILAVIILVLLAMVVTCRRNKATGV